MLFNIARPIDGRLRITAVYAAAAMLRLVAAASLKRERGIEAGYTPQVIRQIAHMLDDKVDHIALALHPCPGSQASSSSPYGAALLGITAAGLLAFGLYGFAEAAFRRITPPSLSISNPTAYRRRKR